MTTGSPLSPAPAADGHSIAQVLHADRCRGVALLHERYAVRVKRWVERLLGPDRDSDDLVQQVFTQILSSTPRVHHPERLDSWMYAITANTVHQELRRRTAMRGLLRNLVTPPNGDLERELEVRGALLHAVQVIQNLPARERRVYLLHCEGKTLLDIAGACEFSLATAKRRLRAASRRIDRRLSHGAGVVSRVA